MSDRLRALWIMLALTPLLFAASYWRLSQRLREQVERTKAVWPVSEVADEEEGQGSGVRCREPRTNR